MRKFIKYHYSFLLPVFCFSVIQSFSQDVHFSDMHENLYQINPSSITETGSTFMTLTYRNQWPGNSDYVTYSAAFFYNDENLKSTAGLQIFRDDQGKGIISRTAFNLYYAYHTKLFENYSLAAGLLGGYNVYSVDYSRLTFENNLSNPGNSGNFHKNFLNISAGAEFGFYKQSFIGLSVSNITSPEMSTGNRIFPKYAISYHGIYKISSPYTHKQIQLEPLIATTMQDQFNEILYGSRIQYANFLGGLYVRQDLKFNFDAAVILLGISFANNVIIYTYDINLSSVESNFNKMAAHEVTFLHKFEYTKSRIKKGAIKCPKF